MEDATFNPRRFWEFGFKPGLRPSCVAVAKVGLSAMIAECTNEAPTKPRTRHPLALRLQCRREWVEGEGTLAEVAQRHGVPVQTLIAWYRREKWTKARNRWHEKQLSGNETPAQPPAHTPDPENAHDARAYEYELQLQGIRHKLEVATDALEMKHLCDAIATLEDVYCRYAGIPSPGSRRPGKERPQRQARYDGYGSLPMATVTPSVEAESVRGHDWLTDSRAPIEAEVAPAEPAASSPMVASSLPAPPEPNRVESDEDQGR